MADQPLTELNEAFHAKARLGIMTLLAAEPRDFAALKLQLGLTDGNLGAHLRVLEELGYIDVQKGYLGRKPRTVLAMTAAGRGAFRAYLDQLEAIIRMARPDAKA